MLPRRTILLLVGGIAAGGWGAFHFLTPSEVEFTRAAPEAYLDFELRPAVSTVHVAVPADLTRVARRMDDALSQRLAMGLDLADPACARKQAPSDCGSAQARTTVVSAGHATTSVDNGTVRVVLPLRIEPSASAAAAPIETSLSFAFTVRGGGAVPLEIARVNEGTADRASTPDLRLIRLVETRLKPLSLTAEDELRAVLANLPVTAATEHVWTSLSRGIVLDEGTQTRLVAVPEVAGAGELVSVANSAIYRIPIAARLSIENGRQDAKPARRSVINGQVVTAGRAAIRLASPVALDPLQPVIDAAFVRGGPFETQADRFGPPVKVEISSARLHPAARMLALQLDLSASRFAGQVFRGKAYLVGRPVLDAERQLVTLADIGFPQAQTADGRRPGTNASAPRLASEPFASRLSSILRLDVSSNIAEAHPRASRLLNRRIDDRLSVSAALDPAQPVAFEVTTTGGWIVSEVGGTLTLTYDTGTAIASTVNQLAPASATIAQQAARRMPSPEPTAAAVVTSAGIAAKQAEKALAGPTAAALVTSKPMATATDGEPVGAAPRKAVPRRANSPRPGQGRAGTREAAAKPSAGRANWVPFPTNN